MEKVLYHQYSFISNAFTVAEAIYKTSTLQFYYFQTFYFLPFQ